MAEHRSNTSYWRSEYTSTYAQLQVDLTVDVAIVGGGITGMTAAYLLQKSGLSVALLEKNTLGSGTTGHTTGKVTSQHNLMYFDMEQRLGTGTARLYGEANQAAIDSIEHIINVESIECRWRRDDSYIFTDNSDKIDTFKREAETAAALGLPATFEIQTPLPFDVVAAVKFTRQASINSQLYIQGLARSVVSRGGGVYEHTKAMFVLDGNPGFVRTKHGNVTAKNIVVATNVPTFPLAARGTYCLFEYPQQTYIVAGKPQVNLRGMYISPDNHHYSILPISDKLLLVSGEGHIPGLGGNPEHRYRRLADYANKHFGVTTIDYRWDARDYIAYHGVPLVGKLYPWSRNLYVATAFKKWGLSNGTVAATLLRDLITGDDTPWASAYTSNRLKSVASIPNAIAKLFHPTV